MKNKENNSYRILSIEAKDLYEAMKYNFNNGFGYTTYYENGLKNTKKYRSIFDYSLDSIKLEKIAKKDFYFEINNFLYTDVIVNVSFKSSYKVFNKVSKNIYAKCGNYKIKEKIKDCIFVENNELLGIEIDKEVKNPVNDDILGKYFIYDKDNKKYSIRKNENGDKVEIKNEVDLKTLRKYLYENGFLIDGIKYVRYKRSSGSSRDGSCLFIQEKYYAAMDKWSNCGLNTKNEKVMKTINDNLVSYEAYRALTLSGIVGTVEINPYNILVLKDYYSFFNDKVLSIDYKDNNLCSNFKNKNCKSNVFDGEGLLDESIFESCGYKDSGMLLLRNRFFKSCVFNTKIQKFFRDNNITSIEQLKKAKGKTLAKNIEDIKLIVTESSIKYLKFGNLSSWRKSVDSIFGIVKTEKKTKFFDGRLVKTNYQILNTLDLSFDEVNELYKESIYYVNSIRKYPEVLKKHINISQNPIGDLVDAYEDIDEIVDDYESFDNQQNENEEIDDNNDYFDKMAIISTILNLNNDFIYTELYKNFRQTLIKSIKNKMKLGGILVKGTYATLFGNPYEFLLHSIGLLNKNTTVSIPIGCVYSKKFEDNKTIFAARSPHITLGNIYLPTNVYIKEIDKYFNLSEEIICVNSINENIQQRLNGCDYDSDTVLITDNEIMINAARKHYDKAYVPYLNVDELKKTEKDELYEIDSKINVNKIGEIVNLSQFLNSLLFDKIHKSKSLCIDENIYKDISILAGLSNMEIDKAKRNYPVESSTVLKMMRDKYAEEYKIKPLFFKAMNKTVAENKKDKEYGNYQTTMDYVQMIMDGKKVFSAPKEKTIKLSELLKPISNNNKKSGNDSKKRESILNALNNTFDEITKLKYGIKHGKKEENIPILEDILYFEDEFKDNIINKLNNEYTIELLIKKLEIECTDLKLWIMIKALVNSDVFKEMIKSDDLKSEIVESYSKDDYDYNFFDIHYKIIKK